MRVSFETTIRDQIAASLTRFLSLLNSSSQGTQTRIHRDRSAILELSRLRFTDVWTLGTVPCERSPRNALSENERGFAELLEIIFIHDHSCNKSVNITNILEMKRFFPRIFRFFHTKYAHMQKNMHLHVLHCPNYYLS